MDMEKKLATAEVELCRLNESIGETAQKHSDDMKRMEEKASVVTGWGGSKLK